MQKVVAAIVASTFALGTLEVFAADAGRRDGLTQSERSDMRTRSDRLTRARANGTSTSIRKPARRPKPRRLRTRSTSRKRTSDTSHGQEIHDPGEAVTASGAARKKGQGFFPALSFGTDVAAQLSGCWIIFGRPQLPVGRAYPRQCRRRRTRCRNPVHTRAALTTSAQRRVHCPPRTASRWRQAPAAV